MTQVIPQLSLETIFRDYCRGVLHPELSQIGMYDPDGVEDDDLDFVQEVEDISELVESSLPAPKEPKNEPEEPPVPSDPEPAPAE